MRELNKLTFLGFFFWDTVAITGKKFIFWTNKTILLAYPIFFYNDSGYQIDLFLRKRDKFLKKRMFRRILHNLLKVERFQDGDRVVRCDFNHDFSYSLSFSSSFFFLGGKRKGKKNNQSCCHARVMPFCSILGVYLKKRATSQLHIWIKVQIYLWFMM